MRTENKHLKAVLAKVKEAHEIVKDWDTSFNRACRNYPETRVADELNSLIISIETDIAGNDRMEEYRQSELAKLGRKTTEEVCMKCARYLRNCTCKTAA